MFKNFKLAVVASAVLAITAPAVAQDTSSEIRGYVTDPQGNPLSGITVEIIHTPTGSSKTLVTSENGSFRTDGLAVGGPYIVKLEDGSTLEAQSIDDLFLQLGRASSVELIAKPKQENVERIAVTGQVAMAGAYKEGPGEEFTERDIDRTPAIGRDIKSLLKRDSKMVVDPTVDGGPGLSVAGSNIRGNSLTVDGVKQNDDFGLNKNGYPGRRSPISLDAIEQVAVNIAPFDVTYGDFQGGNINVVTKSGTNELQGSAFYFRSDDSMIGDKSEGQDLNINEFQEDTYGFTLGGPIVKDSLFFFAAYEKFESVSPYQFTLDDLDGIAEANERQGVSQEDFERIAEIAQRVWNYDIGGYDVPKSEEDEKLLIKLDWYINDAHRASLTYQDNEGNTVRDYWAETFPGAATATAESNRYNQTDRLEATSLQVFSDWTPDLSTEIKIHNKEVVTSQEPLLGANFAQFRVFTPNGGSLYIGPDQFRHANELENKRFGWKIKADYYLNYDHKLTMGWEHEKLDIYNLFVFGSLGFTEFASIEDFENNLGFHVFQNSLTGNPRDAVDAFDYSFNTFYVQDEWTVNYDLTMTYGLRYTKYKNDVLPAYNPFFEERHGYTNQNNFDGLSLLEPRVGFSYTYDENTVVRGGLGLFGGGSPNVWLSNSYGNDGVRKAFAGCFGDCFDGRNTPPEVLEQLENGGFSGGNSDTNSIAPDFEIPSVYKLNLGVERVQDLGVLGDNWLLTADVIFSKVKNAGTYRELNLEQMGTAPDGRPIYNQIPTFDLSLENTDKGRGQIWTVNANKRWESDLGRVDFNMGYTYQDVTEVNPGNAFIAFEGYAMPASSDFQSQTVYNSEYEVRHAISAGLTWSKAIFGDNQTMASLVYTGRAGRNYSHTMRSTADVFGGFANAPFADWTGFASQLLYIPDGENDPLVSWADGSSAAFYDYVAANDCLADNAGSIARRHSCSSDWINIVDLRLMQEVKLSGDHKLEFIFDIENLGNLLNDDWGRAEGFVQPFNAAVVDVDIQDGQYIYSNFTQPVPSVARVPSLWKVQLGVRYKF